MLFGLLINIWAQVHFTPVTNSGQNMTVVVVSSNPPQINGSDLVNGDEIAVYNDLNECVGAVVWNGVNTAFAVYGKNTLPNGAVFNGMKATERLQYKIWDQSADIEINASVSYTSGDSLYNTNGISVLSSLAATQSFVLNTNVVGPGSVSPNLPNVQFGQNQQLTITPNASSDKLDSVIVDGVNEGAIVSRNFTNVMANHTIVAYFHAIAYSEQRTVTHNLTHILDTLVDSTLITGMDTTVTTICDSIIVDSNFIQIDSLADGLVYLTSYDTIVQIDTISLDTLIDTLSYRPVFNTSAVGRGSITPNGVQRIPKGSTVKLNLTPDSSLVVVDSIIVNGLNVGGVLEYTLYDITTDQTIVAYFSEQTLSDSISIEHKHSFLLDTNINIVVLGNMDTVVTTKFDSISIDTTINRIDSLLDDVVFKTIIDTVWLPDTINVKTELDTFYLQTTQNTSLSIGWNYISMHVELDNMQASSIFGSIPGLVLVKDGEGNVFMPSMSVDNIGAVSVTKGYQVLVEQESVFLKTGKKIRGTDQSLSLSAGWHLIPFWSDLTISPAAALSAINSDLIIVKDEEGQIYMPSFGIDNITSLMRGKSYLVLIDAPVQLNYPN